MNFNI